MKATILFLLFATFGMAVGAAQPTVAKGGVLNAASYAPYGLPNSPIAQGSIFVVFGSNMGPATLEEIGAFPLPKKLGGTSIQAAVNGTTVDALMIYTSASQVAAILPSSTPAGSGTLTVSYNGAASAPVDIQVVPSSVGIFAMNQAGSGPGVITDAVYTVPQLTSSASPNQTLILWATGLGPVTGDEGAGPLPGDMKNVPIEVWVGNQQAAVTYRGRSGCCAGLDQIVFQVPASVEGCRVPVVVKTGTVVSNFVSMPIAAGGKTCSDPVASGSIDWTTLAKNGKVSIGLVDLSRSSNSMVLPPPLGNGKPTITTTDSGLAEFNKFDFSKFNQLQNPFGVNVNSYGACSVYTFKGMSAGIVDPFKPVPLDAGAQIAVNGPNGARQLTKDATINAYFAQLGGGQPGTPGAGPLYLDAGSYTVTGPGGADVGAFTANLSVAQPLTWTNEDAITTVTRSQGQPVTWTGGDPAGIVTITGSSIVLGTAPDGSDSVGAIFTCTAKAADGQFTIPALVLSALPPSSSSSVGGISIPTGSLSVASGSFGNFTATGIDYGVISSSVSSSKGVTYQ